MSPTATFVKPTSISSSVNSFQELLNKLAILFESDEVDVDALKQLMLSYRSKPSDWIKYSNLSEKRYTRVLVDGGNGKYNLMLLCWPPTVGSTIHDHPDSHCIMKMLSGSLTEVRYSWPEQGKSGAPENNNHFRNDVGKDEMKIICETHLDMENSVAYINDSIGLHRVVNRDEILPAFSLHLYCPPFNHCRVFDEKTGQYRKMDVSFDKEEIGSSYKYLVKCQKNKWTDSMQDSRKRKDVLIFEKQLQQQTGSSHKSRT